MNNTTLHAKPAAVFSVMDNREVAKRVRHINIAQRLLHACDEVERLRALVWDKNAEIRRLKGE